MNKTFFSCKFQIDYFSETSTPKNGLIFLKISPENYFQVYNKFRLFVPRTKVLQSTEIRFARVENLPFFDGLLCR